MNGKTERSWGNGGKGNDTLDGLEKTTFCNKVAKNSTAVEVQSLPPTTMQPNTTRLEFIVKSRNG